MDEPGRSRMMRDASAGGPKPGGGQGASRDEQGDCDADGNVGYPLAKVPPTKAAADGADHEDALGQARIHR